MRINEVVEEHHFMKRIEELKTQFPRIYEIKDAICWVLARSPEIGTEIPYEPEHRIYETSALDTEATNFWIFYRTNKKEEKVYLISIMPIPDKYDKQQK